MSRVMVVEDDHTILKLVDAVMTECGHDVATFTDGAVALDAAIRERPDVVLLDIGLPGMSGFDVLRALKDDVALRDVPVVMVTAWGEAVHVARALDHGAHDYVRKPFETEELIARVDAALRIKAQTDSLFADRERLSELARNDTVTALPNRRHLEEVIGRQAHACRRVGRPFSLVMVDLDHFSGVNTQYGHEVGDHALRAVAKRLRRRARASDVLGRWGGEEFMIIAPDTELGGGGALAEDLRLALAEAPLDCGFEMVALTASFGVAQFDGSERPETLIARADAALYDAKRGGRNAVRLAESAPAIA
jgi:two-component system cell cycle response regulator